MPELGPLLFVCIALLSYYAGKAGEYLISLKRNMYKVLMKSGNLTKELWIGNEVKAGDKVRDEAGRVFRVLSVHRTPAAALHTSKLEVL